MDLRPLAQIGTNSLCPWNVEQVKEMEGNRWYAFSEGIPGFNRSVENKRVSASLCLLQADFPLLFSLYSAAPSIQSLGFNRLNLCHLPASDESLLSPESSVFVPTVLCKTNKCIQEGRSASVSPNSSLQRHHWDRLSHLSAVCDRGFSDYRALKRTEKIDQRFPTMLHMWRIVQIRPTTLWGTPAPAGAGSDHLTGNTRGSQTLLQALLQLCLSSCEVCFIRSKYIEVFPLMNCKILADITAEVHNEALKPCEFSPEWPTILCSAPDLYRTVYL